MKEALKKLNELGTTLERMGEFIGLMSVMEELKQPNLPNEKEMGELMHELPSEKSEALIKAFQGMDELESKLNEALTLPAEEQKKLGKELKEIGHTLRDISG